MNVFLEKFFPDLGGLTFDLADGGFLSPIVIVNVLASLALVLIFYYAINSPRFSRWYHWLLILIVNFIINFLMATFYARNAMIEVDLEYNFDTFVMLGIINAAYSLVLFVVFSFCFKWWSTNCSTSPI